MSIAQYLLDVGHSLAESDPSEVVKSVIHQIINDVKESFTPEDRFAILAFLLRNVPESLTPNQADSVPDMVDFTSLRYPGYALGAVNRTITIMRTGVANGDEYSQWTPEKVETYLQTEEYVTWGALQSSGYLSPSCYQISLLAIREILRRAPTDYVMVEQD